MCAGEWVVGERVSKEESRASVVTAEIKESRMDGIDGQGLYGMQAVVVRSVGCTVMSCVCCV